MVKEIYSDRRNIFGESEDYQGRDASYDKEVEKNAAKAGPEEDKVCLENVLSKMLFILKKDIPAKTEKNCLKTVNFLRTKLYSNSQ